MMKFEFQMAYSSLFVNELNSTGQLESLSGEDRLGFDLEFSAI